MKKDKSYKKMSPEDLQGLLAFRRKHGIVPPKKGKGSYKRQKRGNNTDD